MAIIKYRTLHATGKSQSGGVHHGLLSDAYHAPGMNRAPDDAAITTSTMNGINDVYFHISAIVSQHNMAAAGKSAGQYGQPSEPYCL
jgi:hypothetical protein